MSLRDTLGPTASQPQYSFAIWAVLFILVAGISLFAFSRQVILEIDTNANMIEATTHQLDWH